MGATRNRGGNPTDKITPNVYYHHTLEPQATTIEHQQQLQQRQTNCNNFGEFDSFFLVHTKNKKISRNLIRNGR